MTIATGLSFDGAGIILTLTASAIAAPIVVKNGEVTLLLLTPGHACCTGTGGTAVGSLAAFATNSVRAGTSIVVIAVSEILIASGGQLPDGRFPTLVSRPGCSGHT